MSIKPWHFIALALIVLGVWIVGGDRKTRLAGAPNLTGTPYVLDGDTIDIKGVRIRLHGIDSPEQAQQCTNPAGYFWACGESATEALRSLIGGSEVECWKTDMDRYGRTVAVCRMGEVDINGWMVRNGWAVAYRRYSSDYTGEERKAKSEGLGIWAGTFEEPERWRWRN